jgi:hypothetical protein
MAMVGSTTSIHNPLTFVNLNMQKTFSVPLGALLRCVDDFSAHGSIMGAGATALCTVGNSFYP